MKKIAYLISIIIILISPFIGESTLDLSNIFDMESTTSIIFWELRVPRIILAFFLLVLF